MLFPFLFKNQKTSPLKKAAANKFLIISLLVFIGAVIFYQYPKADREPKQSPPAFSAATFQTANGWGYRIFVNDTTVLIEQPFIPGKPGMSGFESPVKAQKASELVLEKLKKGQFPPEVTLSELEAIDVL